MRKQNRKYILVPLSATMSLAVFFLVSAPARAETPGYRLPGTDMHQRILWGSTCEADELGLKFGGEDQAGDDGCAHTQIRRGDAWVDIYPDLRKQNHFQTEHDDLVAAAKSVREIAAAARRMYFDGSAERLANGKATTTAVDDDAKRTRSADATRKQAIEASVTELRHRLEKIVGELKAVQAQSLSDYDKRRLALATKSLEAATSDLAPLAKSLGAENAADIKQMSAIEVAISRLAEGLDCEPPPRALSPIVYEPKTKRFVAFGGDHCDYLTNDTWLFDPATSTWTKSFAESPPPRANHHWKATGDGSLTLTDGYTYTSTTDYMGGQYRDLNDGSWIYDAAHDTWSGGKTVEQQRVYRTGIFLPEYFLADPAPDAAPFADKLKTLPENTWVYTAPPRLPKLNRDWGSAVIDPDHDLILRFSGGHCAHGGSDVLQYHMATNRWELPFPVEFPLGQLYTNTDYPAGFNFNHRPWITGHTYQNYGYDTTLKKMLFVGQKQFGFVWDPEVADWTGRSAKPPGMSYDSCFYSLTTCTTPDGLVCWTNPGELFRFDAAKSAWSQIKTHGEKLPPAEVDNSTALFDSKRNRLLIVHKPYGNEHAFDGQIFAVQLPSGDVTKLSPEGMAAAAKISYLCQLRYDAASDLVLVGATLPPDETGLRRTPAYDCAANRWVSLRITGDDPNGPDGRNVSLGLMYDARRQLFWAVDTNSKVFVLRLKLAAADIKPL